LHLSLFSYCKEQCVTVRNSAITVRNSAVTVTNSAVTVRNSAVTVRNSAVPGPWNDKKRWRRKGSRK
jgi:hypothetical protein